MYTLLVPGLNKSRGIARALHRDYYYLRLTSVQFSNVNIINEMKRMAVDDDRLSE